ncbi:hypothetical protein V1522DRAFT_401033 [Lipomyces starkeyi]
MVLETYRAHGEKIPYGTILDPSRSFTIVEDGKRRPAKPSGCRARGLYSRPHLDGDAIVARPVNFFRRDWFEARFQGAMVRKRATGCGQVLNEAAAREALTCNSFRVVSFLIRSLPSVVLLVCTYISSCLVMYC